MATVVSRIAGGQRRVRRLPMSHEANPEPGLPDIRHARYPKDERIAWMTVLDPVRHGVATVAQQQA